MKRSILLLTTTRRRIGARPTTSPTRCRRKLAKLKDLFLLESTKNKNLPIGGGMWSTLLYHPEDAPSTPYKEWLFTGAMTRMPEPAAPKLGKFDNTVSMEIDVPANANGVLYSLAGFAGGLTCYIKDGILSYEYNIFEIDRIKIRSKEKLPTGKAKIELVSKLTAKVGGPMHITLKVNDKVVAEGQVPVTAATHFGTNDCLDLGSDLGSPV
jgi:hypothetical protein